MTKDFELRGRFIFSKRILGLGVHFEIKPPYAMLEISWSFKIDLIWIRFWIEGIKKTN